ncbi:hypothetical protein PPTG_08549 [Phytophthora nicotianae INRA-310]|uniref:Uncharacterized protein n=1 Tax=Phytophthora nicotianae (strain INRA-310) TaxID=761204 RepID=W2QL10_PHYN3|nr:hypothetical protein PPTG_08549 [Phytophthora nicotianae INRA-310]ETN13852.1 hypothetical protein PPTG_08549 [Phytophthora nicotianae INRA-310]
MGGVEPIPATIGESFSPPPVQQLRQELPSKSAKNSDRDQLAGLFDPFVDDDDGLPVGASVDEQTRLRPHEHAASKKRSRDQPREFGVLPHGAMTNQRHRTALNHDALIVEKLSGDPQLLDRFLQVREASGKHSDIAREVELAERIVEFTEETLMRVKWSEAEVASLVYWINDLLEEFRGAAENGDGFRQVRTRCSTDDRLLKDLMFVKVHRQVDTLRAETVAEDTRCQEQRPAAASRQQPSLAEKKRLGRIPRDVLRRLPVQVDPATGETTALCMRLR